MSSRTVLWWGRSDIHYSRNSIIRKQFKQAGWNIIEFSPRFSFVASLEARLKNFKNVDLVWVPCFRQRDAESAAKWCKLQGVPLIFDPLISAYDKQVHERQKFSVKSKAAQKLLQWESKLFQTADLLIADTQAHADYFSKQFGVAKEKVHVVFVSADEALFSPLDTATADKEKEALEVLFYGSYVPLQGPDVIVKAASQYQGAEVSWSMIGDGSLRKDCEALADKLRTTSIRFEGWLDYQALPKRIQQADVVLGVFGDTPKAARVIPNKVFQALAMGKPVITQSSSAYPQNVQECKGIGWVSAGNAEELAKAVAELAKLSSKERQELGKSSQQTYEQYLSEDVSILQFNKALQKVNLSK